MDEKPRVLSEFMEFMVYYQELSKVVNENKSRELERDE